MYHEIYERFRRQTKRELFLKSYKKEEGRLWTFFFMSIGLTVVLYGLNYYTVALIYFVLSVFGCLCYAGWLFKKAQKQIIDRNHTNIFSFAQESIIKKDLKEYFEAHKLYSEKKLTQLKEIALSKFDELKEVKLKNYLPMPLVYITIGAIISLVFSSVKKNSDFPIATEMVILGFVLYIMISLPLFFFNRWVVKFSNDFSMGYKRFANILDQMLLEIDVSEGEL
jgi:hypothetical protein